VNAKRALTSRADAVPALAEAFREHGFEGTSLERLSQATGLGKGSLYNFFPGGKEEMMDAVLTDIDSWFSAAIFAPLEKPVDPATAIRSMIKEVTNYFRAGGRVCLVGWIGLGSSGDVFANRVRDYFARWISALAHCLEAGHVPPSQAGSLAEETVCGIQGAIILSRALGEKGVFERIVARHETVLLNAIARAGGWLIMQEIASELRTKGFSICPSARLRDWLGEPLIGWSGFAASWEDLGDDQHMADGGRYRRRRYAVFQVAGADIQRAPHQPHYQSKVYNRLNGGLARWFEPVAQEIGDHPITRLLISRLVALFGQEMPATTAPVWHIEMHQFRIEAGPNAIGLPTPEGIHRDGVDGAFVMLVRRDNVASGITEVYEPNGASLGRFTLRDSGDAVMLDDKRVFHGVTRISPLVQGKPAIRDVLVITLTRRQVAIRF
jgi:TetR/AcrR family transcriptional repressor of lmrAB and yxaGH operons